MKVTQYEIYADGSCKVNPGNNMAYGIVVIKNNLFVETTVSIMNRLHSTSIVSELLAFKTALEYIKNNKINLSKSVIATIFVDSRFVYDTITGKNKKIKKNLELIEEIKDLYSPTIKLCWIKGHSGEVNGNSLVDYVIRGIYLDIAESLLINPSV